MSGASPGRGHPGWGSSPSKAQASRPTLGDNTQASSNGNTNPRVIVKQCKATSQSSTVSKKEESRVNVSKVMEGTAAPVTAKKPEVKLSVSKEMQQSPKPSNSPKESSVSKQRQPGAEKVRQLPSPASGVQLPSPASGVQLPSPASGVQLTPPHRQRRTSLERQRLQENLQQQDTVTGMARSGRTRAQASGSSKSAVEPGASSGTIKSSVVKPKETSVFKNPEPLSKPQKETARAPELQLAEEIPGLVKKMDCVIRMVCRLLITEERKEVTSHNHNADRK
ncbi:uncharacterized protein [Phyllobates terribilis]|uniref:uncharacterized protein n=1 Tax=Phyllobates terribilis TaxID=111132 RepID=UPI003CCAECFD